MATKRKMPVSLILVSLVLAATVARADMLERLERELVELVEDVSPQVVTVQARFPASNRESRTGIVNIGTGLVLDSLGYIVTSSAVISRSSVVAPSVTVIDYRNRAHEALLYAIDRPMRIAVLYAPTLAENGGYRGRTTERLRTSEWESGRFAIVVGNSSGVGPSASLMTVAGRREPNGFWLLSAPATPGSSGAPVFDSRGYLGGIIVGEVASTDAAARSRPLPAVMVPVSYLRSTLRKYVATTAGARPWLGISVRPHVGTDGSTSVRISDVFANSPASRAGLREGDVLVSIDGNRVDYLADLATWMNQCSPGRPAELRVIRGGRARTMTVTVGRR